jgi:hypothetical protein
MDVEKIMAEFYSLADPDISLSNLVAGIMMLKSDKGLHDEMALWAASRIPQETAMLAMTRGEEYMNSIPAHILFENGTMKVNIPETSLFVMGKGGSA